jgi:hypothetical protein
MSLRHFAFLLAGGLCLAARAASWTPVPGAPDVQIDLASLQQQRTLVTAWLRWWGRPPLAPELAAQGVQLPRVHRTALLAEFDCSRRTVRTLAANAYDGSGVPVVMSATPGPVLPVRGDELAWAYDAACEAARGAGRF